MTGFGPNLRLLAKPRHSRNVTLFGRLVLVPRRCRSTVAIPSLPNARGIAVVFVNGDRVRSYVAWSTFVSRIYVHLALPSGVPVYGVEYHLGKKIKQTK
jgi:hypothetical protein